MSGKDFLAGGLGNAVGEREFEVLGEELLDVWSLDISSLLDLLDFEDLYRKLINGTLVRKGWKVVRGLT